MPRILLSSSAHFLSIPRKKPLDAAAATSPAQSRPRPAAEGVTPKQTGKKKPRKLSAHPVFRGIGAGFFRAGKRNHVACVDVAEDMRNTRPDDTDPLAETMSKQDVDAFWQPAILQARGISPSKSELAKAHAAARRMAAEVKNEARGKSISSERQAEIDAYWGSIADGVAITKR